VKKHDLTIETVPYKTWTEFRATCSCGWGPHVAEQIEYLTASWLTHERMWAHEGLLELHACVRDALKIVNGELTGADRISQWNRWADRLVRTEETS
jgi:hypothetical protein